MFHMSKESSHLHRPGHSETGCTCNKIVLFVFCFVCFLFVFFFGGEGGVNDSTQIAIKREDMLYIVDIC